MSFDAINILLLIFAGKLDYKNMNGVNIGRCQYTPTVLSLEYEADVGMHTIQSHGKKIVYTDGEFRDMFDNTKPPSMFFNYSNDMFTLKLPYNPAWGSQEYCLNVYDVINQDGKIGIQFGHATSGYGDNMVSLQNPLREIRLWFIRDFNFYTYKNKIDLLILNRRLEKGVIQKFTFLTLAEIKEQFRDIDEKYLINIMAYKISYLDPSITVSEVQTEQYYIIVPLPNHNAVEIQTNGSFSKDISYVLENIKPVE